MSLFEQSEEKKNIRRNPGQNFYLAKYQKAWLGKRAASGSPSLVDHSRGRKRAKTNMEICLAAHPHLERFSKARPDIS